MTHVLPGPRSKVAASHPSCLLGSSWDKRPRPEPQGASVLCEARWDEMGLVALPRGEEGIGHLVGRRPTFSLEASIFNHPSLGTKEGAVGEAGWGKKLTKPVRTFLGNSCPLCNALSSFHRGIFLNKCNLSTGISLPDLRSREDCWQSTGFGKLRSQYVKKYIKDFQRYKILRTVGQVSVVTSLFQVALLNSPAPIRRLTSWCCATQPSQCHLTNSTLCTARSSAEQPSAFKFGVRNTKQDHSPET